MTETTPSPYLLMLHYLPHPFRKIAQILLVSAFVSSGCARAALISPEGAFRETQAASVALSDDLDFAGLSDAITQQHGVLQKSGDTLMKFGAERISRKEYGAALERLSNVLTSAAPSESKLAYIRDNFRFLEWYGGKDWGEILLTSYFEPIISGSPTRTEVFTQPLYARPEDLVVIELNKFSARFKDEAGLRGRIHNGKVSPYYSRQEIDDDGALRTKQLELCWVDPTDAFFLHIQGSGTVRLPDEKELFITYAEKNGHKYEPIGKFLKERLAPLPVTMQRIEGVVKTMTPQERSALFAKNPSYVFFTISKKRAITSLGIPATPGRTIAADPKFAPKGALALITFHKPDITNTAILKDATPPSQQVSRLVLDQDSGGAITGTDHIDLFWGRGDEAKKVAGILQDRARIVYLFPKREDAPN